VIHFSGSNGSERGKCLPVGICLMSNIIMMMMKKVKKRTAADRENKNED
jgi:hypothetical protein